MPTDIWEDAHRSIDQYAHEDHDYLSRSVHGNLMANNSFINLLKSSETVYLLHVTTSLDKVLPGKELFSSGGCLVGSIYCVPLYDTPNGLRPHNLGSYIFEQEVQRSLVSKGLIGRTISALVIEATSPVADRSCKGVDYLKLGAVHLQTFLQIEHTLESYERKCLEGRAAAHAVRARPFLQCCHDISQNRIAVDDSRFFSLLEQAASFLPILGYLYFEALSEYIMLFSKDARSMALAKIGELNCWSYKEAIFRLQPSLLHNFNLGDFRPSLEALCSTLRALNNEALINVDIQDLIASVKQRLSSLVNRCLLATDNDAQNCLSQEKWNFDVLRRIAPHLLGHIIDRDIRRPNLYRKLHHHFDRQKAKCAWEYWNGSGVAFPFNGILPKGEVGINPAHKNMQLKIYRGTPDHQEGVLHFKKAEPLDLQIVPKFLDPEHAFMGITTRNTTVNK